MTATVARFATPHEAHLAKLRLEAAGIEAFLADENLHSIQPLLAPALGWVRLLVDEDDFEDAQRTLATDDPSAEAALARLGPEHLGRRTILDRLAPRPRGISRTLGRWLLWVVLALVALRLLHIA